MAVRCSHCGEELMGAVNRCWKCGQQFTSRPGPSGTPPVRRAPVAAATLAESPVALPVEPGGGATIMAEVAGGGEVTDDSPAVESGPVAESGPAAPVGPAGASPRPQVRRAGSPFGGSRHAVSAAPVYEPPALRPAYPQNVAAVGGAIGALVLGLVSLVGCLFTNAALVTGLLGIVMGVWGLYSTRRGLAVAGLLVCLLALSVASFNGAVDLYEQMYGKHPFQAPPTQVGGPDDEWEELE